MSTAGDKPTRSHNTHPALTTQPYPSARRRDTHRQQRRNLINTACATQQPGNPSPAASPTHQASDQRACDFLAPSLRAVHTQKVINATATCVSRWSST